MRRFAAAVLLPVMLALAGPVAAAPQSEAVSQEAALTTDQDVLRKAEAHLQAIRTMTARFMQMSSTGAEAEGAMALQRPGRMRLEYDAPSPILVVADGRFLIYVDEKLNQVSHLPLESTPAGILLRENLSFADPEITVAATRSKASVVEIDVAMTNDRAAGLMTLVFSEEPFALRQWRITDAQGTETAVTLYNVRTGVDLDQRLFKHIPGPLPPGQSYR
ncbi:MAG: outer membrane lipoprotein carrier protein LolA [Rhodospirillaceae bacterium]